MFSIIENVLVLPDGGKVEFQLPIRQALPDGNQCYVVLDAHPRMSFHDNVYCVSSTGQILWQIEKHLSGQGDTFGEGRIRKDGSLEFWNSDSIWLTVDRETGKAIGYRLEKGGPYSERDTPLQPRSRP